MAHLFLYKYTDIKQFAQIKFLSIADNLNGCVANRKNKNRLLQLFKIYTYFIFTLLFYLLLSIDIFLII